MKVKRLADGVRGRPRVEAAPLAGAGFEDERLGQIEVRAAFEEVFEERQLDVLPEIFGSLGSEVYLAEFLSVVRMPLAVRPGTHHERVEDARILPLDLVIDVQGAEQVFGIEPAADG